MTQDDSKWEVVKVGRLGWSVHSTHKSQADAELEARRCNIFPDAQFHARPASTATAAPSASMNDPIHNGIVATALIAKAMSGQPLTALIAKAMSGQPLTRSEQFAWNLLCAHVHCNQIARAS